MHSHRIKPRSKDSQFPITFQCLLPCLSSLSFYQNNKLKIYNRSAQLLMAPQTRRSSGKTAVSKKTTVSKKVVAPKSASIQTKSKSTVASSSAKEMESRSIYFWREYGHDYGFLSQWYESAWEHEGTTYVSAEMWMMVQKARLFGDEVSKPSTWLTAVSKTFNGSICFQTIAQAMLETTDAKAHKALGRQVGDFDLEVWDQSGYCLGFMTRIYLRLTYCRQESYCRRRQLV